MQWTNLLNKKIFKKFLKNYLENQLKKCKYFYFNNYIFSKKDKHDKLSEHIKNLKNNYY